MSISGEIYGRVMISIVMESTKERVAEERERFRSDNGCKDQISVLKQLFEKYREKRKELYAAFIGMEKA